MVEAISNKENSNFFKTLFARFWAFWGLVTFIITFIIIFIPSMCSYFLKGNKGQYFFIKVSKVWMHFWLMIIRCPVKIKGLENFSSGENYVITYNHNALLDVPLSAPFIPGPNKTIAKASFAKVPIFGLFYKRGSVLVDRNNTKSRLKSLDDMKTVLADGMHMCIYPEGTRNRTNESLKPFYDGAFRLAIDAKKSVIPCIIIGTKKAMPVDKKFYLMPTNLQMTFLPPISSQNISTKDLKEKVFNTMKDFYDRNS